MEVFDGKTEAKKLDIIIKQKVAEFGKVPVLGIIWVGDNKSSEKYINVKKRVGDNLGIDCQVFHFDTYLPKILEVFNKRLDGYIIQLPLPENCTNEILKCIPANKDPDNISYNNSVQFYSGNRDKLSPVICAVTYFFDFYKFNLANKRIVILGKGEITGKPLSYYLSKKGAEVTLWDKFFSKEKVFFKSSGISLVEKNYDHDYLDFDMVISCFGVPNIVKGENLKKNSIFVDFGSGLIDGKLVGDLDVNSDYAHLSHLSPSPGGMGPLVVRYLFMNLLHS